MRPSIPFAPNAVQFATILALGTPLLLWPAFYNGYPLVFADTGTYLSQAIERYLGWDRPVLYSLFLLPLHLTLTTWPAIVVQAALTIVTLRILQRSLLPALGPLWLFPLLAAAGIVTALPWFVAQLMPDLFTPLLVLALALLACLPQRLARWERRWLIGMAAFAVAAQQSSIPLATMLAAVLLLLRRRLAGSPPVRRDDWMRLMMPILIAVGALLAINVYGHRRFSVAPYGNVFLLARVLYDGPGREALQQACPQSGWKLCPWRNRLPPSADDFLWGRDSPVLLVGGHKAVSQEAGAIVTTALLREPGVEAAALLRNTGRQLADFATGDGLHAWHATLDRWMIRDFPRFERLAYAASRQSHDRLAVPGWMQALHAIVAVAGVAGCVALVLIGLRRPHPAAGLAAAVLLALVMNAAIAGGISGPHDRYQSRVMLLPPLIATLGGAAIWCDRRLA